MKNWLASRDPRTAPGLDRSALTGWIAAMLLAIGALAGAVVPASAAPAPATPVSAVVFPMQAGGWRYKQVEHGQVAGFQAVTFDDSSWDTGRAAFGTVDPPTCSYNDASLVHTPWAINTDMLLRRTVTVPATATTLRLHGTVDDSAEIFVNGVLAGTASGGFCGRDQLDLSIPARPGSTLVLAVRGSDTGVASFLDMELTATSIAGTGFTGEVAVPDIKVVRFLSVPLAPCLAELATLSPPVAPENQAEACAFLTASSNPVPPASLTGKKWEAFVKTKEFRGFAHLMPTTVSCRNGFVAKTSTARGSGVSQGWTPVLRPKARLFEHAEFYGKDRYRKGKARTSVSADKTSVTIDLRMAARIAKVGRAGQLATLGYDAPYIWTVLRVRVSCAGTTSTEVTASTSAIPRSAFYLGGQRVQLVEQSTHLASFIQDGGRKPQKTGKGYFVAECQNHLISATDDLPEGGAPCKAPEKTR